MSNLYFNEERDYSEENTCENEVFCFTILQYSKTLNISHAFFYKQHFYKQRQAEICNKSSKC